MIANAPIAARMRMTPLDGCSGCVQAQTHYYQFSALTNIGLLHRDGSSSAMARWITGRRMTTRDDRSNLAIPAVDMFRRVRTALRGNMYGQATRRKTLPR